MINRSFHTNNKLFCRFLLCFAVIIGIVFLSPVKQSVYAKGTGLNVTTKHMVKSEIYELKLTGANGQSVVWKSSNPAVATVTRGKIKALKAGSTVISAGVSGKTYSCQVIVKDHVDLIIFSGQSNMMGHGSASKAVTLTEGAAYEYKSVTDKKKLSILKEPFGYGQDSGNLVNGELCTGSMVSAFCNAYYAQTKTPVVAVAASKLGSGSVGWSTIFYRDVEKRIKQSVKAVKRMGLKIDHCYLVWMHGENDVCAGTSASQYTKRIGGMLKRITKDTAVEKCMLIQTGQYVYNIGAEDLADPAEIFAAQKQICNKYKEVILISSKASRLSKSYYLSDMLHFNQKGLNLIGKEAGRNAGKYTKSL